MDQVERKTLLKQAERIYKQLWRIEQQLLILHGVGGKDDICKENITVRAYDSYLTMSLYFNRKTFAIKLKSIFIKELQSEQARLEKARKIILNKLYEERNEE